MENRHCDAEADRWVPWAGWLAGGADQPHMSAPQGLLWWVAFQRILESSRVGFVADKRDLL